MSLRCVMFLVAAAAALAVGPSGASAASAGENVNIEKARPLSNNELYQLYNSRSWLWDAGGGYFSVKERRFTGWSTEGGWPAYGVGRWFITNPGKLCFRAVWKAEGSSSRDVTCFSHREAEGVIYQKREPNGEWYAFRNAPARRSDEWAKLRPGDHVASRLRRIQQSIEKR